MNSRRWDILIAVVFLVASVVTLGWWIPNDTETGVLYEDRYSVEIGDAMAPTMLATAIAIVSFAIGISAAFGRGKAKNESGGNSGISAGNAVTLGVLVAICGVSMALMVLSGPALVSVMQWLGSDIESYRHVSDTVPYKYTGFAAGGLVLVLGLISWVEGRISLRAAAIAAGSVLALIIVYDLPFESLLLPPNGSL